MCRFTTIILFIALLAYVTCNIVTKDVQIKDAEKEDKRDPQPDESPVIPIHEVANPNSVAENVKCAKVGEFCITHKDCCSNGCHGYMHRCVSARELAEDAE
ncbi:hypothetical protein PYW08_016017 [Mythimna loreyi]|uniref:Uncharacterized protein n=1 Tax=Mythimna loreyi TaxID=667449 RepID=A0ACC2QXI0_9NEOP|nr:hypothetical protein PYW08_016017 [Mythimna loreyi]